LNPPEGVIATANNRIADAAYPYYLSQFFEPPHRIRRIEQLLTGKEKFSTDELAAMQLDEFSLHAKEFIDMLKDDLAQLEGKNLLVEAGAKRLLSWDGKCSATSVEATIFHVFHNRLLANLLIPDLGDHLFSAYVEILNQCIVPTDRIFSDLESLWFAGRSRIDLVGKSLQEACEELEATLGGSMADWHWGKIHQLRMNHAFGRSKLLQPLLGIGPLAAPGDGMTINLGFYRHSNPYAQTVGPVLRFIIDLNDWDKSGFVLAAGQSGHPSSPHYADQTELWRSGKRIAMSADSEESPSKGLLLLKPV